MIPDGCLSTLEDTEMLLCLICMKNQSLRFGEIRSQLKKNIIIEWNNIIIQEHTACSEQKSYRGGQNLPPVICLFNANKTNRLKRKKTPITKEHEKCYQQLFPIKKIIYLCETSETYLSYSLIVVVMKCLSCGLVCCQNLFRRWVSHHESTLTQQ